MTTLSPPCCCCSSKSAATMTTDKPNITLYVSSCVPSFSPAALLPQQQQHFGSTYHNKDSRNSSSSFVMAAQIPPGGSGGVDDDSPFGRPFSSTEHRSVGNNYISSGAPSGSTSGSFGAAASGSGPASTRGPMGGGSPILARPELINKLEGGSDEVNAAVIIPGQSGKGIITVSNDRSVRVWLLRDSGQFWPSVCHYMGAAAASLSYHHPTRKLFVGVDSGMISEFVLADDFNRMDHKRDYHAHQQGSRVTGIRYCDENKWLLSVGKDKYFQYHCTESGRRIGGYLCAGWCTTLEYDSNAKYVFVGDYSGQITVCKLDENSVQHVNTLKGHSGSIQTLTWDGDLGWLFSGSFDATVFVWDIGGRKGTVFELHGHRNKVTKVRYSARKKALMSVSEDCHLVVWDMSAKRLESPDWNEGDTCQLCNRPFFWNFRAMYDQKQIGLRQHHCRRCGRAVCSSCSTKTTPLPLKGHEFPVRVCEDCFIKVTDEEKVSHAKFHDLKQSIRYMDVEEQNDLMVTVGQDRMVKLWSIKGVL